ncbi:DinB family protein [Neobacillus pocheonensis]|uniref:DinB family protein n=1 Tax=Neobacillus pocheonensis TaxID=363869 RepID=UPI003D2CC393
MERKSLLITPLPGYEPEIGRWLWSLEDVRRTLKERLAGLSQELIDRRLEGRHSIGSLLYHIALIEADWLYEEVLCSAWPSEVQAMFPLEHRNASGELALFQGETIEAHFDRMDSVREIFLSHFRTMEMEDWRKPRVLPNYDVTPEWVVYHLIEHEAHHRGQIFQLLSYLEHLED